MQGEIATLTRNPMLNCAEGECIIDVSSLKKSWIFKGILFVREESLPISTPDNFSSVFSLQTPMSEHSRTCVLSSTANSVYQVTQPYLYFLCDTHNEII